MNVEDQVTQSGDDISHVLTMVAEKVTEHRDHLKSLGFSARDAAHMAEQVHTSMTNMLFAPAPPTEPQLPHFGPLLR